MNPDSASHGLHDQDGISRRRAGIFLVGVLHGVHPVLGGRTVPRRVVNQLELAVTNVVVNRLWATDPNEIESPGLCQFRHLVGGVHRIIATDVDEVAHIVGLEDVDRSLKILVLASLQLIPASANRPGGGACTEVERLPRAIGPLDPVIPLSTPPQCRVARRKRCRSQTLLEPSRQFRAACY